MKYKNKNKTLLLLIILLAITIGYALLSTTLKINGTAGIKSNTWDIHWENVQPNAESTVTTELPSITENRTKVSYEVDLELPGDFYEFTVDAKNDGSVNGIINSIKHKVYENDGVTTATLPSYINYSIVYDDTNIAPVNGDVLEAGKKQTYRIRIEYDSNSSELPSTNLTYKIVDEIDYVQTKEKKINYTSISSGSKFNNAIMSLAYAEYYSADDLDYDSKNAGWYTWKAFENIKHITKATTEQYNTARSTLSSNQIISLSSSADPVELLPIATSAAQDVIENDVIIDNRADIDMYVWYDKNSETIYYYSDAAKIVLPKDSSEMFWGLRSVETIDLSGFDTSMVENMSYFFAGTNYLQDLDLSSFNTSNAKNMNYMFESTACDSGLQTLDFSNFNTSKVESMRGMFVWTFFDTLDLRALDTRNVTDMSEMFDTACANKNINGWDTSKVKSMRGMFNLGCGSIDLTVLNTSNVEDMSYMFNNCHTIENTSNTLDLSSFDTHKVKNMEGMFENYRGWSTVEVSNSFVTTNVENSKNMFYGASIEGQNGTGYNSSHIDKEYARIDTPDTPGYFTYKSN